MWQSPPPVVGHATSIFGGATEDAAHGAGGVGVTGVIRSAGSARHRTIVRDQETTVYSTTCPQSVSAAYRSGQSSAVLTELYRREHPDVLAAASDKSS
jgi:hypothetical protein